MNEHLADGDGNDDEDQNDLAKHDARQVDLPSNFLQIVFCC